MVQKRLTDALLSQPATMLSQQKWAHSVCFNICCLLTNLIVLQLLLLLLAAARSAAVSLVLTGREKWQRSESIPEDPIS